MKCYRRVELEIAQMDIWDIRIAVRDGQHHEPEHRVVVVWVVEVEVENRFLLDRVRKSEHGCRRHEERHRLHK